MKDKLLMFLCILLFVMSISSPAAPAAVTSIPPAEALRKIASATFSDDEILNDESAVKSKS